MKARRSEGPSSSTTVKKRNSLTLIIYWQRKSSDLRTCTCQCYSQPRAQCPLGSQNPNQPKLILGMLHSVFSFPVFWNKEIQGPFSHVQRTNNPGFCRLKLCRTHHNKSIGDSEPRVITEFSPMTYLRQVSEHSLWARPITLTPEHDQVVTWSFIGCRKATIILSLCSKLCWAPWSFSAGAQHLPFMSE